jgi:hypothetical protein
MSTKRYLSNGRCVVCEKSPESNLRRKLSNRLWRTTIEGRATTLFHDAKRRATKRGHSCTINKEFVQKLLESSNGVCQQTGDKFDFAPGELRQRNPYAPSLDQITAGKGYTPHNTQVVVGWYNRLKGDLSDTAARKIIENTNLRRQ